MSDENVIVVVNRRPIITIVQESPSVSVLKAPGPQGPRGPVGPPGGSFYETVVSSPAATWVLNHNSGRRVHVTILNDAGEIIFPDVDEGAPLFNTATITFSTPTTGSAVIS